MSEEINFDEVEFGEPIEEREPNYRDGYIQGIYRARNIIDNQQKEIERLKERENMLQESFSDWKKRIEKERKYCLCERTDCCGRIKDSKKYSSLYQENERLNNIINKGIEYILGNDLDNFDNINNLLNILKGSDKE